MIQHNNYKNKNLTQILDTFSLKQRRSFALYCSKDVEQIANDQRVIDCNNTIQLWLNDDKSVDLELARTNAWNAAAASYAAYSAYSASYFASAAASYAAYSAYSAAYFAAYYAASAKSFNLFPNEETKRNLAYNQFYNEYNQIAQNWLSQWNIPNFPKDEPDFPLFDYLIDYNFISYLLPKKEDYYYLNLNGFTIKHVNEAELLKLIDTTHIKTILWRIINNETSLHFA